MKLLEKGLSVCMMLSLATLVFTVAYADTWDEIVNGGGDAGDFPAGDFQMSDGSATFDRVTGNMADGYDSYLITCTDENTFYIEDLAGNDTKAFCWAMDGTPLFRTDDNAGPNAVGFSFGFGNQNTHQGTVIGSPLPINTGDTIVLTVGSFGDVPNGDAFGTVFFDDGGDFSAQCGPTGENFASYNPGVGNGSYDFTMVGAELAGGMTKDCILGDMNEDGVVDLLDVNPFVTAVTTSTFSCPADVNEDGIVDLLDVNPFVMILTGG